VAGALILDAEAFSVLARPHTNRPRHRRVIAAMTVARRDRRAVRVPSLVLMELWRGRGFDEPIDRQLARGAVGIITAGARIARTAGHILVADGSGSEHAIDAIVVATAARLGGGQILTHDPADLQRLAAGYPDVTVAAI